MGAFLSAWYSDGTGQWGGWAQIDVARFQPGTPVAAAARRPDLLDLFATDTNGAVLSAW